MTLLNSILHLMQDPGGYEVTWDYCLENNIAMPGIDVTSSSLGCQYTAGQSISGDLAARTVMLSESYRFKSFVNMNRQSFARYWPASTSVRGPRSILSPVVNWWSPPLTIIE